MEYKIILLLKSFSKRKGIMTKALLLSMLMLSLFVALLMPEYAIIYAQDSTSANTADTDLVLDVAQQNQIEGPAIVVGSKDFNAQLILGEIMALLLEEAGYNVVNLVGYGGNREVRAAVVSGELDLYPEYTGTFLSDHVGLPTSALPTSREASLQLARSLDERNGLVWLEQTAFNESFGFMVRDDLAGLGLANMSDLATYLNENVGAVTVCIEPILSGRVGDGFPQWQEHYGIELPAENVRLVGYDELYEGLRDGECDVAENFTTDGRIAAWGLNDLPDDRRFFPLYHVAPVVRQEVLDIYPELGALLSSFVSHLDDEKMRELNARVDIGPDGIFLNGDEEDARDVARSFLTEIGLLKGPAIVVGSKDFNAQLILGEIMALLLEEAGYNVVNRVGYGGNREVRAAVVSGELDLYPEYTGTFLSDHVGLPTSALPTSREASLQLARSLDERNGLVWLEQTAFNESFGFMVRDDLAGLGLANMSDLATYLNENAGAVTVCIEPILSGRVGDGFPQWQEHYGIELPAENVRLVGYDELYEGLLDGECDVAENFTTDGRIAAWGLNDLPDDRRFFPLYHVAPVVRQEVLDIYPELGALLSSFVSHLDDEKMRELNARVDIGPDGIFLNGDEEDARDVARSFLTDVGLLKGPAIVVGSKDFNAQLILGEIMALLLEEAGYNVVNRVGYGGNREVRAAVVSGELDLYPEYTGTFLSDHVGLPTSALPTSREASLQLARSLDERNGLVWLEQTAFNESFGFMVRDDLAGLGLANMSDLATYLNENAGAVTVCIEPILSGRVGDGFPQWQGHYGIELPAENVRLVGYDELYEGLRDGECDVAENFTTDGRIAAWGLNDLPDDRRFFPLYHVAPVVRQEVLDIYPELGALLSSFVSHLDDEKMRELNARVDIGPDGIFLNGDEEDARDVARSFLTEIGLINAISAPNSADAEADTGADNGTVEEVDGEE